MELIAAKHSYCSHRVWTRRVLQQRIVSRQFRRGGASTTLTTRLTPHMASGIVDAGYSSSACVDTTAVTGRRRSSY